MDGRPDFDAIVVGGGFAGLYALHLLRERGLNAHLYEAGESVGGTWYWNAYPGARCDAQSLVYSYMFDESLSRAWEWSERYAGQREILSYLNWVSERLDLATHITLETFISRARFDEDAYQWTLETSSGLKVSAKHVIMATGALSAAQMPQIAGREAFSGDVYHTGRWPRIEPDFRGKRVGVIGTGSSGVQLIPRVAEQAQSLTVFQRTPAYVLPARNAPTTESERVAFFAKYSDYRTGIAQGNLFGIGDIILSDALPPTVAQAADVDEVERERLLEGRWSIGGAALLLTFGDTTKNAETNKLVTQFCHRKIREAVDDPVIAERLVPKDVPFASRRVCVGENYYETFNRSNVSLVDLRSEPIERLIPEGIMTTEGLHPLDVIIFATGFDAITGALASIDIRGVDGVLLKDAWAAGPSTYLGLSVTGYPNLFMVSGPGSPSVLGNAVANIQQQVEWIAELLEFVRNEGIDRIEADPAAQHDWTAHVAEVAGESFLSSGNGWATGANTPGKARIFLPYSRGIRAYRTICEQVQTDGYRGFSFRKCGVGYPTATPPH